MPISVDWGAQVIDIPQSYLTLVSGSLYSLDLDVLRNDLKTEEASEDGIVFLDTHSHNTEVTLSGITLSRVIEFINGYTVTFEDLQYGVEAKGANSNLADVLNRNQVSLRSFNSAGLITVASGSGLDQEEHDTLLAIKPKTDNLPDDPADQSILAGAIAAVQADTDDLQTEVATLQTLVSDVLGAVNENVQWSGMTFDSNGYMTGVVITQYTDSTLTTARKSWQVTANYDGDGKLTSYEMVEQ